MIAALAFVRNYWRAILVAVLLAAAGAWLYHAGALHERAGWLNRQAQQQAADAQATTARIKEDNQFVAKATSAQAALQRQYDQLNGARHAAQQQFKLTVPAVVAQCSPAPGAPAQPASGPVVDPDPMLSLGAVWLWNSALSGSAAPAGACQFDAATGRASAACASASGLTLDAAWDNQATNAQACALDRANHQRLIDFINQREKGTTP
jgi:hypothetical protein